MKVNIRINKYEYKYISIYSISQETYVYKLVRLLLKTIT